MANEAVIIELLGNGGDPIRFTCADGTGIEKGTLMELTDPRTVIKISAADKPVVGIAAAEKVASDGATTIAVYTNGIFDLSVGSGATTVLGNDVVSNGSDNTVDTYDTLDDEKGYVIGKSLETGGNSEVVAVRVLK
ncbi:hypothetical protein CMI37_25015 [Candidatus Pacearchaeota archaeon]|nr:hypothetical protein [Candidatus Pacearchaeota archaeon]|tara:strand:- start:1967 stop:2374 length:408 start_codon:yes stop_codon:yes gene_type:complete